MSSSHFASSVQTPAAQPKDNGGSTLPSGQPPTQGGGTASTDWGRRANGTSSTSNAHRRPSLSTTLTHPPTPSHPLTSSSSNVYHPPHHYNRSGAAGTNTTYSKDELLNIYKTQESGGFLNKKLDELILTDLNGSGTGSGGGWGRSGDESLPGTSVDGCWDRNGGLKPVTLVPLEELSDDEQKMFASNVNSPHKVPTNNQGTPNHHTNHNTPPQNRNSKVGPQSSTTPGSGRPQNRRRETSDAAMTGNPFAGTPPQITRRRTDLREEEEKDGSRGGLFGRWGTTSDDHVKDKDDGTGGRNTGLFRRGSAAWGGGTGGSGFASSGALNSPMGSFGNGAFGGGAMGGFSLGGDKSKPGGATAKAANNQPKVDEVEERAEEETAEKVAAAAVDDYGDEQDRPMTSDTDPYGITGDHDDQGSLDQRHSPLPSAGIGDPQRIKTSSPFSAIAPGSATTPRVGNTLSTPVKTRNDLGFSAFGGSREQLGSIGVAGQQHMIGLHQQLRDLQINQQQGGNPLHGRSREGSIGATMAGENEPLSPTETNPYQSPAPEKADEEDMANDMAEGGGGLGSVIAGLKRGEGSNAAPGSDRSGRSSTAGLGSVGGGLGGFGSLSSASLWGGQAGTPGGLGSSATPASSFFGTGVLGDLNSPIGGGGGPSLLGGGIGPVGGLGGSGPFGSQGRASRLGPLFAENQQQHDETPSGFESEPFGSVGFGGFGSRRGFGAPMDSPMRERGDVADLFGFPTQRSLGNIGGVAAAQEAMFPRDNDPLSAFQHQQGQQESPPMGQSQTPGALNSAGQPLRPPPGVQAQQHVMVMPDKMQWVYRDPSGTIQGPFSGLEMHDWYRAGFFTSELYVRRVEDTEFEMLGNMVRRIGNTREPFLVPLPGSASAGTSTTANSTNRLGSSWLNDIIGPQAAAATPTATTQPGAVQPPFAGSFPTFGTTLTAEQQNALERRKQEEQYLMAKQREYLVQQQVFAKQQAAAQQLHHAHSAQSLHSQPSFGSLHSPGPFAGATTPAAPAIPGLGGQNAFEPGVLLRQAEAAARGVDPFGVGAGVPGQGQAPGAQFPSPQQQQPPQDQIMQLQRSMADQQKQQLQRSYQMQQAQQVEKQLQQAQEQAHAAVAQVQQQQEGDEGEYQEQGDNDEDQHGFLHHDEQQDHHPEVNEPEPTVESPTPMEQPKATPKAPSVKTSPAPRTSQPSAWGQPSPLVQPFPPAPGSQYDAVPMARSPSIDTPSASIAPWAKENETQALKTPSLKEIQEIEAKQAAAREAQEAQARRESLAQQQYTSHQPPAPAPGLPSTATWATSPSTTPAAGASAWNKPLAKASTTPVGGRKTLQQIQKEEEARKAKAAAQAASQAAMSSTNPQVASVGKRYADLASKTSQAPGLGGAWTTVGPGGKSKTPAPATPTGPASTLRPAVSAVFPPTAPAITPKKILTPQPPSAPKSQTTAATAQDEFMKWCRASMKGLNTGVNPDEVITNINNFPSDPELIADTIYAVSSTMDGRRFAEEYMRRQKAAQAGVVIEAGTASNNGGSNGGGWNEVAKGRPSPAATTPGGPSVPETNSAFKVVNKKNKGRR